MRDFLSTSRLISSRLVVLPSVLLSILQYKVLESGCKWLFRKEGVCVYMCVRETDEVREFYPRLRAANSIRSVSKSRDAWWVEAWLWTLLLSEPRLVTVAFSEMGGMMLNSSPGFISFSCFSCSSSLTSTWKGKHQWNWYFREQSTGGGGHMGAWLGASQRCLHQTFQGFMGQVKDSRIRTGNH